MEDNVLHVKNMVCARCISSVESELNDLKIPFSKVQLGEIFLENSISPADRDKIDTQLRPLGFEILSEVNATLIEKIKRVIIDSVQKSDGPIALKYSVLIQESLHHDYNYLSTLFSSVEGITIEKFTILQKIERIKELLSYDQMPLKEITQLLGYSSAQHLSNQFKKETGLSPGQFKRLKQKDRKPLDNIS